MQTSSAGSTWMIYGANGYTGALAARRAHRLGERPVLAGRNRDRIERLGHELQLPTRIFDLSDPTPAARALEDMTAVLHCAGPFSATARPMLDACVSSGTHYLDISGELSCFEHILGRDAELKRARVAAIPGAGFDVVPSDCLAVLLKQQLPEATHLRLAFRTSHGITSPGSAKTMLQTLPAGTRVRRNGNLITLPPGSLVDDFPFTDGPPGRAVALSWGDVATAYRSTGIPNIECYIGLPRRQIASLKLSPLQRRVLSQARVQKALRGLIERFVKGPDARQRENAKVSIVGEVRAGFRLVRMRITCPEGYEFTATTGVESTLRAACGAVAPGAHTPAMAFGPDYAASFPGVTVEVLSRPRHPHRAALQPTSP